MQARTDKSAKVKTELQMQVQRRIKQGAHESWARLPTALAKRGIETRADLIDQLPKLRGSALGNAIDLAFLLRLKKAVPALRQHIDRGLTDSYVWRLAFALGMIGGPQAGNALRVLLAKSRSRSRRLAAVHGLYVGASERDAPLLLSIALDEEEDVEIRSQAIEGVGSAFHFADRRRRVYKDTVAQLLPLLGHAEPSIRFWACFALGHCMRAKQALPKLRKLARADKTMCCHWWTVGEEAEDAIAEIARIGSSKDRGPMCRPPDSG